MNNLAFGQYYHANSFIHRLDARVKIIISCLFMVMVFLVPYGNFIGLAILASIIVIVIGLSKVPFIKFLRSVKHITLLLVITFVFTALFSNKEGTAYLVNQNLSIINILFSLLLLITYFLIKKYLPLKLICFLITISLIVVILHFDWGFKIYYQYHLTFYKEGIIDGLFLISRVLVLIVFSCTLTLTTKPTDINLALELLMAPLEKIKIKTSILAMTISIALRSIPTLFLETEKILKAQASRGVDFNEGRLKDRLVQIVSLIIPMFIVSFKRAEGLADAMEARGYIPGAKRTKLLEMRLKWADYVVLMMFIGLLTGFIIYRVI